MPGSRVPVLAGRADLDQREADAGISARHPILIDPKYQIDPVLAPACWSRPSSMPLGAASSPATSGVRGLSDELEVRR